jgi:sugar transferase (PEP-CTERM/EpsH1 system associated)
MRVLFLTQRLPYAPNRGDRVRGYHLLRFVRTFADVEVVSLVHDREEAGHVTDLQRIATVQAVTVTRLRNLARAVPSLFSQTPLTHILLHSPRMRLALNDAASRRPDVILAFGSGMARFCTEPPLVGLPLVLDMVDADSVKWATLATKARLPMSWVYRREASCLGAFERTITASARCTTVVNERERDVLRQGAPKGRIEVVPVGVDTAKLAPHAPPEASGDVVFCGVMNYPPNEEGAVWLATMVWPLVRRQQPTARLLLIGSSPGRRVQALANAEAGIVVTGSVPEVTPYLWSAAVSAAPLFTARGVQNKVLEAVAAGLPAVITSPVAEGLPAEVLPACTVADEPEPFARALVDGLRLQPNERRRLASSANLSSLTWEARLSPFRTILERAAAEALRPPATPSTV